MFPDASTGLLSSKMTINIDLPRVGCSAQKHISYYLKYCRFVVKSLELASFQQFLCWMLKKEKIEEQKVSCIDIKVFPRRRKNGKCLAGNCDVNRGKIRIYPKPIKVCLFFTQKFGKQTFMAYAGNRAQAALIHELLHLKYVADEPKVRELTREYFFTFTKNHSVNSPWKRRVNTLIFRLDALDESSENRFTK